ncbi:ROK family transcriptional regulator [Histidinibacterium aquaticum]|uniref:ROK family transcriptional regulator n=1 Tax=Histidinibacterium aquaticum TaxID=2613962 RepID=A0A5J5GNW0_9RHOB|nr:ROK family transcriptional regulator [Histidinibacterium aquaticum]KAA9009999.1 ROK family transcriptional regulator [Histidinibacterium aquaticum]
MDTWDEQGGWDPNGNGLSVSGTNQTEMRERNERLVLTLLRRRGGLAKAEIARLTGLSAQTAARIISALEHDGLIVRGEPKRGRVGQPSIPMSLNPEGAFFQGLKVGRRSVELVLIDFLGRIVDREKRVYAYPDFEAVLDFAATKCAEVVARLGPDRRERVSGLGIAIPFHLWSWAPKIGVSPELMVDWKSRNIHEELSGRIDLPIFLQNDATSACSAELVFGQTDLPANFTCFYLAFFIGGGLVLRGSLFTGSSGNAAGFGPLLVPDLEGRTRPLIDLASLATLETRMIEAGLDASQLWQSPADWDVPDQILEEWLAEAANALAYAIRSTQSTLDVEAILLDGWLPRDVLADLAERVRRDVDAIDMTGMTRPHIQMGTVGPDARPLGAASLPLTARYLIE